MTSTETENILGEITRCKGVSCRYDLHTHTTISDGSDTFEEVIQQASERGLTHVAFTNHDTTQGLYEALAAGERFGIVVIGGIEISAWNPKTGRKVHILGYGLTDESPAINSLCGPLLSKRNENSQWQLEQLLSAGYNVDLAKVRALEAQSTALYKQHIMTGLTDAAYGTFAYKELYTSLFKGDGICSRDIDYVHASDAVEAIIADGGVAVLAHPGQLESYDIIPELVSHGLKGIEKYHHDHTTKDHQACDELAAQFDLITTGGSDYHGRFGASKNLGSSRCD